MMRIIEFFMMTVDVSTSVLIFVDGTFTVQISRPEECRTMYMHTDGTVGAYTVARLNSAQGFRWRTEHSNDN